MIPLCITAKMSERDPVPDPVRSDRGPSVFVRGVMRPAAVRPAGAPPECAPRVGPENAMLPSGGEQRLDPERCALLLPRGYTAATCLHRLTAAGRVRHRSLNVVVDAVRETPPVAIASGIFADVNW